MFYQKVSTPDIIDRIIAEAYSPEFLDAAQKIKNSKLTIQYLGDIVNKKINNSIRNVTGQLDSEKSSIPMFRPADISNGEANVDSAPKLSCEFELRHEKSRVYAGDIVLGIAGSVGCVGRVPANVSYGNINGSSARISLESNVKSAYLLSYLQSKYGQASLLRYSVGSVQKHLNLEDLPKVTICTPHDLAQQYIGDKVRQAEQLRAWVKGIENILVRMESEIPANKAVKRGAKYSTATLSQLTENRLDAKFYEARHLELAKQLENGFVTLGSICSDFKYGASVAADYVVGDGIVFIRGNAISPNDINKKDIVTFNKNKARQLGTCYAYEGEVLVTRSGTVGVVCDVFDEYNGVAYGSFVIKCTLKLDDFLPEYLSWFLNSWIGKQQFRRWENGAVQLNINIEELSSIYIWEANQIFQEKIRELIVQCRVSKRLSESLTTSAKYLVETLIEGHLTEQDLITTQQALESGDNTPDRAILQRLKTDGLDGEGQPLFPDLDQLYELLTESAEAQT